MLTVVPGAEDGVEPRAGESGAQPGPALIDELVCEGARRMLASALQAEVEDYVTGHGGELDENGRRLVVRNGSHQARQVATSAGAVEVRAPRVNDRRTDPDTGQRMRFSSSILAPWCRKTPKISEVLPLLYLHGLSSRGLRPRAGTVPRLHHRALGGHDHQTVTTLTETSKTEQGTFAARDLSGLDFV